MRLQENKEKPNNCTKTDTCQNIKRQKKKKEEAVKEEEANEGNEGKL